MNICASSESGYRAIGATICSSSSGLNDNWAAPPAGVVVGAAAGAALPYRLVSYGLVWPRVIEAGIARNQVTATRARHFSVVIAWPLSSGRRLPLAMEP